VRTRSCIALHGLVNHQQRRSMILMSRM
jgi:hypothetical protein